MAKKHSEKDSNNNVSHIANLLTSILLCYPEIATINLDPKSRTVKFTFYLSNGVAKAKLKEFHRHLKESLRAYYYLEKREIEVCSLVFQSLDFFTTIEFQRDVQTLSQKEIALIIALIKEEFGSQLVTEEDDGLMIDDLSLHEELIGYMLENAKRSSSNTKLIALRDEGKVFVFNK
ncbi:MAG: hypothetical protein HPY58_01250 [Firmicutes bacterium]|nr:hypothetical protein [Bacillota bacterium]